MPFRSQWRDKQAWLATTNGAIELNTASDEAARSYDAVITQLCGWYEDDSLGGLSGSIKRMLEADPEFVLGRALELELNLMGALAAPRLDKSLAESLGQLNSLAQRKRGQLSEQERLHVEVVNFWSRSQLKDATQALERILTLYPADISALKMNQDTYFMLGTALQMRNSIAGALPKISRSEPNRGYAHGMFSFALEESNMYPQAQREALKALELIPNDTWAIHNYAHCLEMQALTSEGLKWMQERKCDWEPCQMLACHQNWHTALFHINSDHFDEAIALLDNEVLARCVSSATSLDLHDAASMVYRMELVNLFEKQEKTTDDASQRWAPVYELYKSHKRDHLLGFNDAHFMMTYLGMGDLDTARELIESVDEVPSLNEGRTVVKPLLEAMLAFKTGDFERCVNLLEPIRFDIIKIGGSHAQRDIFEQLLLVAALKSDKLYHNQLGRRMLLERETMHGRKTTQTRLLEETAPVRA